MKKFLLLSLTALMLFGCYFFLKKDYPDYQNMQQILQAKPANAAQLISLLAPKDAHVAKMAGDGKYADDELIKNNFLYYCQLDPDTQTRENAKIKLFDNNQRDVAYACFIMVQEYAEQINGHEGVFYIFYFDKNLKTLGWSVQVC